MLKIKASSENISSLVDLPISKSLMNRYLIMKKLAGGIFPEKSSAYPNDVNVMIDILSSKDERINSEDAGSVMRFAAAFFSAIEGQKIIEGEGRMHERPIGILVNALRELGGDISYLEKEGYPPLLIKGKKLKGGYVKVESNISSQFISALLMIAPTCQEKTIIELSKTVLSRPYIDMTIGLMSTMGVEVKLGGNKLEVLPGKYNDVRLEIERDWSSASFIYETMALSEQGKIELPGLDLKSMQGDKACVDLFALYGVTTEKVEGGLMIKKEDNYNIPEEVEFDFAGNPDLVQPALMTALGLGLKMKLNGLFNLHLKESNRIEALKLAVENAGGELMVEGSSVRLISGRRDRMDVFQTFADHRMAMSIAPLAIKFGQIEIDNGDVVSKSFPNFWTELKHLKFDIV